MRTRQQTSPAVGPSQKPKGKSQIAKLLTVVLLSLVSVAAGRVVQPEFRFGAGLLHEPGVATRGLLRGRVELESLGTWKQSFVVGGNVAFAALDNPGLAHYGLDASVRLIPYSYFHTRFVLFAHHDEWGDWRVGENRVGGYVTLGAWAVPWSRIRLDAGAAFRAPQVGDGYTNALRLKSDAGEWNVLYGARWAFLSDYRSEAAVWLSNHDEFTVQTPQLVPFGLDGWWQVGRGVTAFGRVGTGINGVSGLLLSFSELRAEAGVKVEL
jgi:hypothetical protein